MFRHVADEYDEAAAAELLILSKGLVYQLAAVVERELGSNLPIDLVATSRAAVSATDATVDVTYRRFDAGGSELWIGDTVASGATIIRALEEYRQVYPVSRLHILSYAGTRLGAARIADHCQRRGIDVTFLFGLAAFALGANGFDLSFLHPDALTREVYRRRADRQFGGRQVSCVGWDFGSQAMAPEKYRQLCWMEAEVWDLHGAACLAAAAPPASAADMARIRHEAAAYGAAISAEALTELQFRDS